MIQNLRGFHDNTAFSSIFFDNTENAAHFEFIYQFQQLIQDVCGK